MKKVLFATTALVATAGVAAADITLKGSAQMGIFGGDTISNTTGVVAPRENQFLTDVDVTFTMSGTTDNGLTFGASIDLDESDGTSTSNSSPAFDDDKQGGETLFISGGFGTLTMGDTDGAFDWALTELGSAGTINSTEEGAGFNGNSGLDGVFGGQILRYDNTIGGLGVALSAEIDNTTGSSNRGEALGIGLKYTVNLGGTDLNFGLGYQTAETATPSIDDEVIGLSIGAKLADVSVVFNYSEQSRDGEATDISHIGISGTYSVDAWTFGLLYGQYDDGVMSATAPTFSAGHEASNTALTVAYDLGGGAKAHLGYNMSDVTTTGGVKTDANQFSFGLAMSF